MTLQDLIAARMEALGLDEAALVAGLGIRHRHKGQAFLARVSGHDMRGMVHMRRALVATLDVPLAEVEAAIVESNRARHAALDALYRAEFSPHACVTTERQVPTQIVFALVTGAPRWFRVPLPEDVPRVQWPAHVAQMLPKWLVGFGSVTGFAINYTPDHAVLFDREGRPIRTLDRALRRASGRLKGISSAATIGSPPRP